MRKSLNKEEYVFSACTVAKAFLKILKEQNAKKK
jgi:hypothetical protein